MEKKPAQQEREAGSDASSQKPLFQADNRETATGLIYSRGGGGKLSRSETVTVRLDPRLNYLCELASRAQRRTKSSFIEWAIEKALKAVEVPGSGVPGGEPTSINDLENHLWDVDEADRIAALAFNAPTLMNHEEQVLWKFIKGYGHVWRGDYRAASDTEEEWSYRADSDQLIWSRLRENFETIKAVVQGRRTISALPTYVRRRPITFPGLDRPVIPEDD